MGVNMVKQFLILLAVAVLLLSGCNSSPPPASAPQPPADSAAEPADSAAEPADVSWSGYFGALTRRDSSQDNNATLQVKSLDNSLVLFEIDIVEGSESEDRASSLQIAGTMIVAADGAAVHESLNEDGSTAYSISFSRSADGQLITVTHTGDIPLNPDGDYDWTDFRLESDAGLAVALLENLPTAATSLNSNAGAYTINYPEESVLNYFYPVTVTLDDTGTVLAEYVVCADMSAVWRLDTEGGVPALIYGSAQDMLDQVVWREAEENGDEDAPASAPEAYPLLDVILEGGTLLEPGAEARLLLDAPYPFPCAFELALSTDDTVATVDEAGVVTALKPGSATIFSGNVVVEDGKRSFSLDITVGAEGDASELEADDETTPEAGA
jgi:hypothetical protein